MKRILLTIVAALFFAAPNAQSIHVVGAEMYLEHVSEKKYNVVVELYRDCREASMSGLSVIVSASGAFTQNLILTKTSIEEVPVFGPDNQNECDPPNTNGSGYGLERHTFEAVIDFDNSPYNTTAWQNACEVRFGFGQCCRSSSITTGLANANHYIYMTFDKCLAPGNSTPVSYSDPLFAMVVSQPVYYNFDVKEADGDSFSIKLRTPQSSQGVDVTYGTSTLCSKKFSAEMPITPFLSNPCSPYIPNPNLSIPEGVYLGANSGELIFVPNKGGEVGVISIEITEWRKISGVYKVISVTIKEMQVIAESSSNNYPSLTTSTNQTVVAGRQNCFTINFEDNISPPPATPDTLTVTWTDTIAGASFTVNENNRLRPATFCWTPACNDARTEPYQFRVIAKDNVSPYEGRADRLFMVKVVKPDTVKINTKLDVCEGKTAYLNITDSASYTAILWSDNSTGKFLTTTTAGDYWVRAVSTCGDTTYDTVTITYHPAPVTMLRDTNICEFDSLRVGVFAPNANFIEWSTSLFADSITIKDAGKYRVTITDKYCGVVKDSMVLKEIQTPFVNLGPDQPTCKAVNKNLDIGNIDSVQSILWSTGKTTNTIFAISPQKYWVTVTTLCGVASDTVDYSDKTVLDIDLGADTFVCNDDITLTSNRVGENYLWSNGKVTRSITTDVAGTYIVRVAKCTKVAFDTIVVDFGFTPEVDLGMDIETDSPFSIVLDAGVDDATYLWSTNENTKTISVNEPGEYWVQADNDCGTDRDTVEVSVKVSIGPNPIAERIDVYPNPASDYVTINFINANVGEVNIELVSATGKVVYSNDVNTDNKYMIDISELPDGVYFMRIIGDEGSATIRIVVN